VLSVVVPSSRWLALPRSSLMILFQIPHARHRFVLSRLSPLLSPQFAKLHPSYKEDSVLPADLVYDLAETCNSIASGAVEVGSSVV
jgi:hypothetical protein